MPDRNNPMPSAAELDRLAETALALGRARMAGRGRPVGTGVAVSPAEAAARTEARKAEAARCKAIMAEGKRMRMVAIAEVLAFDTRATVEGSRKIMAVAATIKTPSGTREPDDHSPWPSARMARPATGSRPHAEVLQRVVAAINDRRGDDPKFVSDREIEARKAAG